MGLGHGMLEGHTPSVQADGAVWIAAWIAVFQVAAYGAADMCQLAADLVMSAREQFHFKEIKILRLANHSVT